MARKRITFTLDEKVVDDLKRMSEETLIPQAQIANRALTKEIEEHKKNTDKQK